MTNEVREVGSNTGSGRAQKAGEVKLFSYPGPKGDGGSDRGPKRGRSYPMVNNDICVSTVQVFEQKGAGTTLHYHNDEDGYWLVLGGRAEFYNSEGSVIAELGKHQGIFIPRFTRYWFENSDDDEPLEILRVSHHSKSKDDHLGEDSLEAEGD